MAKKKLTSAQQRMLDVLGDHWTFPVGSEVRTCEALESKGLIEGALKFAGRDEVRGLTSYRRAYRRTAVASDAAAEERMRNG